MPNIFSIIFLDCNLAATTKTTNKNQQQQRSFVRVKWFAGNSFVFCSSFNYIIVLISHDYKILTLWLCAVHDETQLNIFMFIFVYSCVQYIKNCYLKQKLMDFFFREVFSSGHHRLDLCTFDKYFVSRHRLAHHRHQSEIPHRENIRNAPFHYRHQCC